jgi:ribonuclease J
MIQIATIGGYNEVGKNMTAINIDDEVVILDCGLHLDKYISYVGEDEPKELSAEELQKIGAIPDDSVIEDWRKKVKAIIPTHAHLDHVGALPYLANKYNAPILMTPFTSEVLKAITKDDRKKIHNKIRILNQNSTYHLTDKIKIEFIAMTHSTLQVVMVAIHTKYGAIIYANDFKFDNFPVLGQKPNYKRLKEIGKKGVIALISDGTRADKSMRTPSESVAREMLKDLMSSVEFSDKAVIITTFSSHIARLKSIIEFGRQLHRKIIFLGRSLHKYVTAAENIGMVKFTDKIELIGFSKQVRSRLKKLDQERSKYLIVTTGHQGEPNSVLTRIAKGETPFHIKEGDYVIFSCTVIPNATNAANREELEKMLRSQGARMFKDIHVSGHASREDLRDLITMTQPKNIIPAHGDIAVLSSFAELAGEMGYKLGKNILMMRDGERTTLNNY